MTFTHLGGWRGDPSMGLPVWHKLRPWYDGDVDRSEDPTGRRLRCQNGADDLIVT